MVHDLGDKLDIQQHDQTFPHHTADLRQNLPQFVFVVYRGDNYRLVVGDSEQALVMDLLMTSESHDSELYRRAGDLQLAQPAHDRFIERRLGVSPDVRLVHIDEQHLNRRVHGSSSLRRPAVKQYRLGSTNNVNNKVDSNPPTTTVASGLCTSDPMPVARAAGTIPNSATRIIINTGRNCAFAPAMAASSAVTPVSCRRLLISDRYNTPLMTATPNRDMNPTAAETLRLIWRSLRKI